MERYFTFWRRLGASLFDSLMLLPVSYFAAKYIDLNDPLTYFIWTALPVLAFIVYNVMLTGMAGQTIGKIIMGIKVLDLDEQSVVGIKRAFYRESVYFTIEIVGLLVIGYQAFVNGSISSEMTTTVVNHSVEAGNASGSISSGTSITVNSVFVATHYCWIALELITMLFNSKRRAIHDFLASSVVISLRGQRFDLHYDQLERQRASL
jgi:uncharacterized RDD family membrane protein YckC